MIIHFIHVNKIFIFIFILLNNLNIIINKKWNQFSLILTFHFNICNMLTLSYSFPRACLQFIQNFPREISFVFRGAPFRQPMWCILALYFGVAPHHYQAQKSPWWQNLCRSHYPLRFSLLWIFHCTGRKLHGNLSLMYYPWRKNAIH